MAGLHIHLRAVTVAVALGVASSAGGSCTCADRPVDDVTEPRGEPACLWLISPRAFRADGSTRLLVDEPHYRSGTACLCLTQEEFDALGDRLDRVRFPEEGTVLDEYNELAYDECKRLASLVDGAVDDECLDYYEHGTWLKDIYFARGDWANGKPPGFTCDE